MGARASTLENLSACPLCASKQRHVLCRAWDRSSTVRVDCFEYARCSDCGVAYESIRPREEDAGRYYPDSYGPYHSHERENEKRGGVTAALARAPRVVNRLVDALWRDSWKRRSKRLQRPPHGGARVLDFGCGSPQYLDKARKRGWTTIGMDFTPSVVERVRAAGHEAHFAGEWEAIPDRSLDLVRMNHVIEHLYRPREVLAQLARKMRPGAHIHVATPNGAALGLRVFADAWYPLACPLHVVLYDARALRRILSDTGFGSVEILFETGGKNIARSVAYRCADRGWTTNQRAADVGENPLVKEMLHIPAKFLAASGRADSIHAIAVRGDQSVHGIS